MGLADSEVAIHSAGIILMNDRLNRVPFILELSRGVVSAIRQDLVFSSVFVLVSVRPEIGKFVRGQGAQKNLPEAYG